MVEHKHTDIDDELDELCLRILDLMNDNIRCKMDIERAVRSGCIDLAKTRYIQGNVNSISATKIPTDDFTAATTILRSNGDETPKYELCREDNGKGSGDKSKSANQDPIKWFGFLVPTSLRQGQTWFNKALDLTVHGATIAAELCVLVNTYEKLHNDKKSVETDAVEGKANSEEIKTT